MLIINPQTLAACVRERRRAQRQSQQQVGEIVGLRQATVSAFENTPENASVETLFKLAAALQLDIRLEPREQHSFLEEDEK